MQLMGSGVLADPILVCTQVLFVYHGYQRDFVLGWSLLLGNISTEDKLDPSSVKN